VKITPKVNMGSPPTENTPNALLKIFSPFRIFEQLARALKNRVCLVNFQCIEYIFYHTGFLSKFALALKNRVCPELTVLNIYILSFRIFDKLALALKTELVLEVLSRGGLRRPRASRHPASYTH